VKDEDVLRAVEAGRIRTYVTDFPTERFVGVENVVAIPHLGASTKESEDNCAIMAVDEITDYIENGNISHSVNYPKCNMGTPTALARVCILNRNVPSMLRRITGTLGEKNINISDLLNRSKEDYAYTLVDIDSHIEEAELKRILKENSGIISVRVIHPNR
jgi:D-3-phosphoglycerate dehydrogenase